MRVVLVTFGTEGDTRPLLEICHELNNAGHQVTLLAERSTLPTNCRPGLTLIPMVGDIKIDSAALVRSGKDIKRMAKVIAYIATRNAAQWMHDLTMHASGADAVLFSGIASYVALSVAEHKGIPAIGLGLFPISPTVEFSSPFVPPFPMPGWCNKLSHQIINGIHWRMFRGPTNLARARVLELGPKRHMWRGYPILYGVSRHLVPTPRDWPTEWRVCGPWLHTASDWTPPSGLRDFLADGPTPLYIGFGSMVGFDRDRMMNTIVDAIGARRVVFYPGWSGIDTSSLPSNFFAVNDTPHSWLFPRVSAVMHHGGAGTTHAAALAGTPSIVVPFIWDQAFWATRLASLGVAPAYVPAKKIDAPQLREMIKYVELPQVKRRAWLLGAAMATEDGTSNAVREIERIVRDANASKSSRRFRV
ncbi:MAG TPA: glycosyltransferase [Noviherbaspirillum sp.]|nr:glycosyltransferase [Noviherbaspirillum sp.]